MNDYAIKPFEVMPYSDGNYILKNPNTFNFHLISEYQSTLLEQLEKNNRMIHLLFPTQGISTSKHMGECVKLFQILKKIDLITNGSEQEDETTTTKTKANQASSENFIELSSKIFSYLRKFGLFLLVALSISISIFLAPSKLILTTNIITLSLLLFLFANLATLCHDIIRASLLRTYGRRVIHTSFARKWIFFSITYDERDIWMSGVGARLRAAIIGLLSPFLISTIICLCSFAQWIPVDIAGTSVLASTLVSILFAFPLFKNDGAEIIHLLLNREVLDNSVAKYVREFLGDRSHTGSSYTQKSHTIKITLLIALLCEFLWVDVIYNSFTPLLPQVLETSLAWVFITLGSTLLFLPAIYFSVLIFPKKKITPVKKEISLQEKRKKLENIPLFALLNEEVRALLLKEMDSHSFEPGDYLVKQAEQGSELFILLSGEALAIFKDASGKHHIVGSLKEGDTFGEVALIDDVPRTASILAKTQCEALSLNKENFLSHIVEQFPEMDKIKQLIRLSSFFKRHPLLSKMEAKDQAILIEQLRFHSVVANEELMGTQVMRPKFSLVYTGKLLVSSDSSEDFILESEDCFGYLLSSQNSAFLPSVKAKEGSGLLVLGQDDFKTLLYNKIEANLDLLLK